MVGGREQKEPLQVEALLLFQTKQILFLVGIRPQKNDFIKSVNGHNGALQDLMIQMLIEKTANQQQVCDSTATLKTTKLDVNGCL